VNRPADLVAIPPLARTVIYYGLAVALVVVSALVGDGIIEPLYLVIVSGVGGVFFGVAGSNVPSKPAGAVLVDDTKPEGDDFGVPVPPTGYGSGV
jgi:hypothetical protein